MFYSSKPDIVNNELVSSGYEYDAFFRLSPVPMFIYSPDTLKFLDVNPAAISQYGYSKEEFLSMTIEKIRPEEDIKKLKRMFETNNSDSRVTGYWRHKRNDGSIVFVDAYSHKINLPDGTDARVVTAFDVTDRKIAEENHLKSEQRFRDMAELLPQIVFEFDLDGKLLYGNQLAFDTFKYPYDTDISRINIFNFISPSQIEAAKEDLSRVLAGEKIENREYTLIRSDGTSFSAIVITAPIYHDNIPVGFRGVIMDVSELKNIHKELDYSQKKYSSLFENAQSVMMIIDPETCRFVDANKAAADFYGYTTDKIKQMYLWDLSPKPESEIRETVNQAVNLKQNHFIRHHKLSDGSYRYVEVFTSPILINDKNFLFSVIHDIQERIAAEEGLKKLHKAIEQSPVSAVITDRHGNIEYVNPKFCEITGYSKEEVMGKNPSILKSGEQDELYYKNLWTTISSGKNWYGEFKNKKKSGEYYWESASISPLFDDAGDITHFVAIKEDITERKRKEIELIRAKDAAEEASRLKSNFLTNMSHELRTPLVGILGYADILSSEVNDQDHKEMADIILQSGNQLIETLNSILDLSRIEANKTELDIKTFDLRDILREAYSLFIPVAKSKKLYLKMNLPQENLFIEVDRRLVTKIINNLINNAIKFTSMGGITIDSEVILEKGKLFVQTKVTDSGIGIPSKYHQTIFEPFRQVSEGLSRNFTGSGLGLTLTKKFVDLLNGTISFSSKEGLGSTFIVTLPFSQGKSKMEKESASDETSGLIGQEEKRSVLLVEDDVVNAQIVCAYLNPYFRIEHVLDGQTGIDFCKTKNYDAILMDIALKGISGTVAMQEIKKLNKHYTQIPIIAITAYAMLGDKESFLKAGFSHYISKPFTRSQLFDLMIHIFE
jgi:PAS domain S-box-containing protein